MKSYKNPPLNERYLKIFVIALLFLFSSTTQANPAYQNLVPQPETGECSTLAGNPVKYVPLPAYIFKKSFPEVLYAFSTTNQRGEPRVVYNVDSVAREPKEFQELIYWHECGHHTLGHVPSAHAYGMWSSEKRDEYQADCFSARAVKEHRKFSPSDMYRGVAGMRDAGIGIKRIFLTWSCAVSQ